MFYDENGRIGSYTAVCLNGHAREDEEIYDKPLFCEDCGAQFIQKCPNCDEFIHYHDPDGIISIAYAPSFCKHCGKPYPWTQTALDTAKEYIEEDEQLSNDEKTKMIEVLPDIIAETPKTNLAALRVKKALKAAGKFTAEGIRKFVIDFGCAVLKDQLGI